ncbi:hypothetical protein KD050_07835 [Psychrobacillus sp. INOP01]|uniref:hypothetical protein n=1 Tax=Psychrobacillus sp. INOP01 TaxID=2829187 RepID=UPI001BADA969|nr:hypothetical protein [Psychrobacillus sp. INOP01]QUG43132.1 hypothetical protein KD050_07835 [Psychrobacillus sp. INOP01]
MKKFRDLVLVIIILGLTYYIVYSLFFSAPSINSSLLVTKEDIKKDDFLDNKKAVIYLSTTADQDLDGDGISYAIFIDKNGKSQGLIMEGLELGSTAVHNKSIFLEDKGRVRIIGENYKEFPMESNQYTGERTGFLEDKNIFFSIYNSGFNKNGNDYNSDVRYGNEKEFKTGTIPFYIASSGLNGTEVDILTQDINKNEFNLRKVIFDKTIKIQHITRVNTPKNEYLNSLSPILADSKYYYLILSSILDDFNEKIYLYRIDKYSYKQKVFDFIEYNNINDLVATIPYNFKNSAYIYKNELYFVNGLGDVYTFNTANQKITKKFTLNNASHSKIRHNEETYFKDNYLYVLRYSEKKDNKYYLEKYLLDDGKLSESMDIIGFDELLRSIKRKNVYSYDLKILD